MRVATSVGLAAVALCAEMWWAPIVSAAPKPLSLQQVIDKVRDNPVARAAVMQHRATQAQAEEARGARWVRGQMTAFLAPSPEIRCDNADCTRTSPIDIAPNIAGAFAGARLELFQPLYTFGKLDAAALAGENAAEMQGALAEGVKGDLGVEATRAYFGVALARELGSMLKDGAEQIAKGKQALAERLQRGDAEVTVQDRLRVEALETEILLRLSEAREKEATALEGLRALCGDRNVDVADAVLTPVEQELEPPDEYWRQARTQSPDLRAAAYGVSALRERAELERARWWPDLLLMGAVQVSAAQGVDDPPSAFAYDPFNATRAELALVLRWILEPNMQAARVKRAGAEQLRGQELAQAAQRSVEFSVRDAHNRAVEARKRLELSRQGEKSARGWVTSVMQADAVGAASARDLADAYLAYFTLRSRVLQSTYEWNLAVAALQRTSGNAPHTPERSP